MSMRIDGDKLRNALLSVIATLAGAALIGIWKFYRDWTIDEQTEEAVMFDRPEDKVQTIEHIRRINPTDYEVNLKTMQADQRHVIEELHEIARRLERIEDLEQRTADQAYQTNRKLDTIRR